MVWESGGRRVESGEWRVEISDPPPFTPLLHSPMLIARRQEAID